MLKAPPASPGALGSEAQSELSDDRIERLRAQLHWALEKAETHSRALTDRQEELDEVGLQVVQLKGALDDAQSALASREEELEKQRWRLKHAERRNFELAALRAGAAAKIDRMQAKIVSLIQESKASELKHNQLAGKAQMLLDELTSIRGRFVVRLVSRLIDRVDQRHDIHPAFQQLMDDSLLFVPGLEHCMLRPSAMLDTNGITINFRVDRPNLSRVLLAPIFELPPVTGNLVLDIHNRAGARLAQSVVAAASIQDYKPMEMKFQPIEESADLPLVARIYVRNVEVPWRLWHWLDYGRLRIRRKRIRPFFGYKFSKPRNQFGNANGKPAHASWRAANSITP